MIREDGGYGGPDHHDGLEYAADLIDREVTP